MKKIFFIIQTIFLFGIAKHRMTYIQHQRKKEHFLLPMQRFMSGMER